MSFETLTDRTPSSFATGAEAAREEEQHVRGKRGEQQQSAAPHPSQPEQLSAAAASFRSSTPPIFFGKHANKAGMPQVIVLEANGEVRLVELAREDYEQPEMK